MLSSLAEKAPNASSRKVLEALVRQLYEGRSLSQALGEQPRVFPALYVALVQSSERTGALGDALGRYISYRQRLDVVRQKLVGASVYPLLLLLVGVAWCCSCWATLCRASAWCSKAWATSCRGFRRF